ncbi:MAG: hypothetical protein L7S55_10560, partial [Luminiphilus sp.]|nr:hypothetical protein [Luminiphilus sp.]
MIGSDMSLAADTGAAGTADDLIISTGEPGTITFSADEPIASARVVQLEPFDVGGSYDGSDGGPAMAVYAGANITGVTVDANKFYALDEANYELIEVAYTSNVDGVAHYEIVESGEEIFLTDAAGVDAFEAANTSVGIVPSDVIGDPTQQPSTSLGSMEPVSYELTTPAATANSNEYTASLEALSDGTTPVLSDGIWGLELTDLAGNVTVADIGPDTFVYDVTTSATLASTTATDGVFIVDTDADNGGVATVELMRDGSVTNSISSIGSRDVQLDITGLDEDVSSVRITITSHDNKLLGDGSLSTDLPSIRADLSYDGSVWSVDAGSVTGTWTSIDDTAFIKNADVGDDIPSFIINLAGDTGDEGLSNGAFDIEMTFTDIAGNIGTITPVTKAIDNSADADGDLGLAVDDDALGGISDDESTGFYVDLVGRDVDVRDASIFALTQSDLTTLLSEISGGEPIDPNAAFDVTTASLDTTRLHDEVVDGAIVYQYAVFKDENGKLASLDIDETSAPSVLNSSAKRFETKTYSEAARSGIRLEEVGGVDSNGDPTFGLKISGLTADNYDAASDALVLTVQAVDASGTPVSIDPITVLTGTVADTNGEIAIDLSASSQLTTVLTGGGEPVNASLSVGSDGSVELFDAFALDVSDAEGDIFLVTRVEDGAGNTSYSMALSDYAGTSQAQPLVVDLTDAVIAADMSLEADTDAAGTADDLIISTGDPGVITFGADEAIASARVVQLMPFEVAGSSDGNDGVLNTEPAESAGMGSEPLSYELTTPAATANSYEYTASLEALSDGTTPVLSDGIWGLELTDLAGNVTVADIDPDTFVYDVATDLAADTDGVFIVDTDADTGDVATVEMKRDGAVTNSISSIASRDVELDIEGLDEDVSSVTITITSQAAKTLSDGVTTVTPFIEADLSYDGTDWSVVSVTGSWTSDAAAFVHNADVTSDVPSFIVNLAGTSSDEGLSNGAFDIEMTFEDIAGNAGSMTLVTKEIDNSADVEGDLGLAVDDEALGGISADESTDFHVELVGRDSDVLEATVYALKLSEIEAQLLEIDAGFVAAGAQFDGTLLHDEVVDGAIVYQYAVFKNSNGNKGYLNISEATAAGLLNGQGTDGSGERFVTTTYSAAARSG